MLAEYSKELISLSNAPKKSPRDVLQIARLRIENITLKEQLKQVKDATFEDVNKVCYQLPHINYEISVLKEKCTDYEQQINELTEKLASANDRLEKNAKEQESPHIQDSLYEADSLLNIETRDMYEYNNAIRCVAPPEDISVLDSFNACLLYTSDAADE